MVSDFFTSSTTLMTTMGTSRAPRLIDVCLAEDIAADPWRIPTAEHVAHKQISEWAGMNSNTEPVVVICQKGLKLSHGAAARLRGRGLAATVLTGGNASWFANCLPKQDLRACPGRGMPWVLPAPATSTSLCLFWLIRRWHERHAEILWVPAELAGDIADRFDAHQAPPTLAQWCEIAVLDYPLLHEFVTDVDNGSAHWLPMLRASARIFSDSQQQGEQALVIIDAAWVAYREAAQ